MKKKQTALSKKDKQGCIQVNEDHLYDLLNSINDGAALYVNGNLSWINQTFPLIFGYTSDELLDTKIDFFKHVIEDFSTLIDKITSQLSKNDSSSNYQATATHKNGLKINIDISVRKTVVNGKSAFIALVKNATETCVHEDQESYRHIVDTVHEGIAILRDTAIQYANPYFLEIIGYQYEEIAGTSIANYIHPDEWDQVKDNFTKLQESENTSLMFETVMLGKQDHSIFVEQELSQTMYEGKIATLILVRNISERKNIESALASKDELHKILIEHSSDALSIINTDGTTRYQSMSIKRLLGYPNESDGNASLNLFEIVHPDDREMIQRIFTNLAEEPGASTEIDIKIKHADGTWLNIQLFAKNLIDNPIINGIIVNLRDITEKKKAEEQLITREEHYRALIENTLDATVMLDYQGIILYASPSYSRILGFDWQKAEGSSFFDHIHVEDRPSMSDSWIQLKANLWSTIHIHLRAQHMNGSWIFIELYGHNLLDHPALRAIVVNFRDISDRKEAEEQLIQQEQHFRALIENSSDGISIINADGVTLYESPAAKRQLGYTSQDLEGKHYFDFVHPDDIQMVSESFANLINKPNGTEHAQMRCLHKDGTWRTLEVTSKNLLHDPIVKGIVNNIRDISDRKQAEEALEHRTQQILAMQKVNTSVVGIRELRDVMQLVSEAAVLNLGFDHSLIFLYDESKNANRSTVFYTVNDEAELIKQVQSILGISLTSIEVPIVRGFNIVVDDALDRKETIVHNLYDIGGGLFSVDQCNATQNVLGFKTVINVPFHTKDKLVGSLLVFTDKDEIPDTDIEALWLLADQAAIAIENAKLNEELEQRVEERTRQLEAANQELESFAYTVSHDLRAPLRSISGFSQMLLEDYSAVLDNQGKDYLERICSSVKRMTQLIDGILDLSRLTRGELNREPISLSNIATTVLNDLQEQQPERNVKVNIAPDIIAEADERMIRSVMENLLRNAWKFTSKHETANIEFGYTEYSGKPVYFIRDDGAGFDMSHADKLFGTFQRLHTSSEFEGTGIGLATVQRIINRHGGEVWADSTVEEGATFYFTL